MRKIYSILFYIFAFLFNAQSQQVNPLIAGPLIGETTSNSTRIWVAFADNKNNNVVLFNTETKQEIKPSGSSFLQSENGEIAITYNFSNLTPSTSYEIKAANNSNSFTNCGSVKTEPSEGYKDLNVVLGSCFLIMPENKGKWLLPGKHVKIMDYMAKDSADFNLWLGDNIYYLFGEWSSKEKMFQRQLSVRRYNPVYNAFLKSRPNYAMWDDHDFGPNNANTTFPLKDTAYKVFNAFWPNPKLGTEETKGVFFTLKKADCEFFLTDGRLYREPENVTGNSMLGKAQLEWLKSALKSSNATFKFLCIGSQAMNPHTHHDSYAADYPEEFEELKNFIINEKIEGVILLTGDRHMTWITKNEFPGFYPLYEYMCSPVLSAMAGLDEDEEQNPNLLMFTANDYIRNYGKITVTGEPEHRRCTLENKDENGRVIWSYTIHESELKLKQ